MRTPPAVPVYVNWDLTYACPLRCIHCYSESGRRPSRQLDPAGQLKIAERIIEMGAQCVQFSGGEPLIVPGVFELAEYLVARGVRVSLYTGGWELKESAARRAASLFSNIHVSVDGADAETHDRVRGRQGSFERAARALSLFDRLSAENLREGREPLSFGIESIICRSTFSQMEKFCEHFVWEFPHLKFISFGAVVPAGLASRPDFARRELLTDSQTEKMMSPEFAAHLRGLAPAGVEVGLSDNRFLQMHPGDEKHEVAGGQLVQIEPDGRVRGMAIYEGSVGNLLEETAEVILERVRRRPSHPFVVEKLLPVVNSQDWAAATRDIDWFFATEDDRARISRRAAA